MRTEDHPHSVFKSVATLDLNDVHSVLSMTIYTGDPLARVRRGTWGVCTANSHGAHPADDVMGIMLAYINPN